ncbi:hypothetical protein OQ252_01105 [Acetobacter farinalis]|uniref:Uncharacterized protein n=1 Tax=Acetobacter farinalis TaxID=1260984 RepID=A0ABT3Q3Z2_9PROT|nr:hypothetical protein [Acetobacter farinalis]MCX2560001.1 hypothetical protein [Acetobacter farinalis]NHO28658.1 hypothetical protein [Acetobacter farinalis]
MPRTDQPDLPSSARPLSRRLLLGGLLGSAAACLAPSRPARAALPVDDQPPAPLIVAGTSDSLCGQWAALLAPALADELRYTTPFPLRMTTGWDGVTGANLFDIQQEQATPPSGLVAPGTALLAALTGDPRVHYDAQRWLPVFMSRQPTVAVGKVSLHRTFASILQGRPLRVGVSTLSGPELPTLVALDLLGMRPLPCPGYGTPDAALTALKADEVDMIQLPFDDAYEERMAALQDEEQGSLALFSNILPTEVSPRLRLPPDFTTIFRQERKRVPSGLLYDVWKTTATAASLKAGLMLPVLTPPDVVARFRHAAQVAAGTQPLRAHAREQLQTLTSGMPCVAAYADMMPGLDRILALRRWLAVNTPRWTPYWTPRAHDPSGRPLPAAAAQ